MIPARMYPPKETAHLRTRMRILLPGALLLVCVTCSPSSAGPQATPAAAPAAQPDRGWIQRSNQYTELLLDVTKKHSPEAASQQGLAQYDEQISQPTKQDDDASTAETKAVQTKLTRALALEHDKYVQQDLTILLHSIDLSLRQHDFAEAREIPYENASQDV